MHTFGKDGSLNSACVRGGVVVNIIILFFLFNSKFGAVVSPLLHSYSKETGDRAAKHCITNICIIEKMI